MYDVIYIDGLGAAHTLATELRDRSDACALARATAAERGAERMVADDLTRMWREACRDTVLVVCTQRAAAIN